MRGVYQVLAPVPDRHGRTVFFLGERVTVELESWSDPITVSRLGNLVRSYGHRYLPAVFRGLRAGRLVDVDAPRGGNRDPVSDNLQTRTAAIAELAEELEG